MSGEDRGFYGQDGLHVEYYDAMHAVIIPGGSVAGDLEFYLRLARESGGPVLELACGTGRVAWPLAEAGLEVTGLDLSAPMLRRAEAKRAAFPPAVAARARFLPGDMRSFDLGREFALVLVPFRAFQSLLTPEDQRSCLAAVRRHLRTGGRLVLDLFDPRLDFCLPEGATRGPPLPLLRHPSNGNTLEVVVGGRENDPVRQVLRETWAFTEKAPDGRVLREERETLRLRWSYRYEMRHLLELCGFAVEAEHSDFRGSAPDYGREQVWVARRP